MPGLSPVSISSMVSPSRKGRVVKMSTAQNRLDSTLQAAKKATAPTATKLVIPAHSTSDDTPSRSSTHSPAMP